MPVTSVASQLEHFLSLTNKRETVIASNMANVNTAGYSRELVNFSPSSLTSNGALQSNGVTLDGYTSVRNQVLQLAIQQKSSDLASLNTQNATWAQVETSFSGTDTGLGATLSTFFSDLSALSTSPTDAGTRQSAYAAASQLVDAFHQGASSLATASSAADESISGMVTQINQLSSQIASLNQQLTSVQDGDQDGGTLEDQRDELTTQLAQLTGITSISTESTPTLALSGGSPLVMGGTAYTLQVTHGLDGKAQIVTSQGVDVTSTITGGSLGGALLMRDQELPSLQQSLDQLATQFTGAMNSAQAKGYDTTGNQGQAMFAVPSDGVDAASGMSLKLSTANAIAASSDGSGGSSGNLTNLLAVQTAALPSGLTPTGAYASLVEAVGSASSNATTQATATNAALGQLTSQQSSESGVSIDEETTNLLRYQQAYSAAAQVISTINSLFSVVLNMGTVTG